KATKVEEGSSAEDAPAYRVVTDPAELRSVMQALDESVRVGVDVETTGLDPRRDRIRLLSLATDRGTWAVDCFALDPRPLFELLGERTLILHNAAFDLAFLTRLSFVPGRVGDTMLTAQLLAAGTGQACSLAACTERYLRRPLEKDLQKSNWSRQL